MEKARTKVCDLNHKQQLTQVNLPIKVVGENFKTFLYLLFLGSSIGVEGQFSHFPNSQDVVFIANFD